MKPTLPILCLALLFSSCQKSQGNKIHPSSFTFGYCRCCLCMNPLRCFRYYEITQGQIYADSMADFLRIVPGPFVSTPLSNSKYQLAAGLISNFPQYLQNNPNLTLGNVNCDTHAAVHIEYIENGVTKRWDIDQDTANQPLAIRPYIAQLDTVLSQLQQ